MSLQPKSSTEDARKANTVGEGELPLRAAADGRGGWYMPVGPYPVIDAETGTRFEAGFPTQSKLTEWLGRQLVAGCMREVKFKAPEAEAPPPPPEVEAAPPPAPAPDEADPPASS